MYIGSGDFKYVDDQIAKIEILERQLKIMEKQLILLEQQIEILTGE